MFVILNQVLFLIHAVIFFLNNYNNYYMSFEYDLFYYNILNDYSSGHMQFLTAYFFFWATGFWQISNKHYNVANQSSINTDFALLRMYSSLYGIWKCFPKIGYLRTYYSVYFKEKK